MASEAVLAVGIDQAASIALDRKLLRGITWTGAVRGTALVMSWASWIVVARLLAPADYGLVAMATIYIGIAAMLTDFGLGNAIVALRSLEASLAAQLHTVATLAGVSAFAVSCLVAGPLSRFFGAPQLSTVIVILGTILVLDSLRTVPTALLGRGLEFKHLALLEGFKAVVAVVATVVLAFIGAGYWALVLGNVFATLLLTIYVLARLPHRFGRPRFRELASTLTFSSHFFTGQLTWYGFQNADFLVAGRVLGTAALGAYTLAWNLTTEPGNKLMAIIGRVMPTMLAAVQRDVSALRRYFLLYTEGLAFIILPAAAGLCLVARDLIFVVFGAKWSAAVLPAQLLCFYAAVHVPAIPTMPLMQVTGHASFPARWGAATLAVLVPLFFFGASRWGTVGVAAVWVTVYPLLLLPVYRLVFRTLAIDVRDYAACFAPTLAGVAAMTCAVIATRLLSAGAEPPIALAAQITAGAAAFIAAMYVLYRRRLAALLDFLRMARS